MRYTGRSNSLQAAHGDALTASSLRTCCRCGLSSHVRIACAPQAHSNNGFPDVLFWRSIRAAVSQRTVFNLFLA